MKTNRVVYQNGKYVDEKDAKVSIFDSALMFGDMVFEMTRSFNGEQFKLKEHIDRLYVGLKILQIPIKQCNQNSRRPTIQSNQIHPLLLHHLSSILIQEARIKTKTKRMTQRQHLNITKQPRATTTPITRTKTRTEDYDVHVRIRWITVMFQYLLQ